MGTLTINVTNFSSLDWSRNNWEYGAGSSTINSTDEITQTPLTALMAHAGATTAAACNVHLTGFLDNSLWITLGFESSEGSFAVGLYESVEIIGIGKQDQWAYCDSSNVWCKSTNKTEPYTWTYQSCQVVATPTLSDSSGAIDVVITNL